MRTSAKQPTANTPTDHILWTLDDIQAYYRCGRTKAGEIVRKPGFPAPVRGIDRRWVGAEIREWAEDPSRHDESDGLTDLVAASRERGPIKTRNRSRG